MNKSYKTLIGHIFSRLASGDSVVEKETGAGTVLYAGSENAMKY